MLSMMCLDQIVTDTYALYHGDTVGILAGLPDASVDYILFSPPFSSLYTYSASDRDMGNCRGDAEFFTHYSYLTPHLMRLLKPGRLMSVHCMLLPTSKTHDGVIGLTDFRGALIRHHTTEGMIFHSEVCIWKDPVVQMQRTKALGLLWKQVKKDSAMSRQGLADYLCTFRKPGENAEAISHTGAAFPLERWQNYASPVWHDIDQGDTLQRTSAREDQDERHIAPLQLGVIRRGVELWSRPGDVVLDPFAGIGSTGVVALQMGRRFVGTELKTSYYQQASANCAEVGKQGTLFP